MKQQGCIRIYSGVEMMGLLKEEYKSLKNSEV
jgi:hypothetical protein